MQVHQFSSNFAYGDAISDNMRTIQKYLREWGYESEIYSNLIDEKSRKECKVFTEYKGDKDSVILVHASVYSEVLDFVTGLPDRKVMIYHNVTPAGFFEGYNKHFVALAERGRKQISELKDDFDLALGVSEYNRKELEDWGYSNTGVFPIFVDFERFELKADKKVSKFLDDEVKNILFFGRFAPNKKHDDLLKAFYVYNKYFEPNSRLILIGRHGGMELYYSKLMKMIKELGLEDKVLLPGLVPFEELVAYLKGCDLFLSMSEHEGFFVPLLECFYMGLPVLAFDSSAVAETMGGAGVLMEEKKFDEFAGMMDRVVRDLEFRNDIVERQKERIKDFDLELVKEKLKKIINKF